VTLFVASPLLLQTATLDVAVDQLMTFFTLSLTKAEKPGQMSVLSRNRLLLVALISDRHNSRVGTLL
jgi:hypothetical protein